MWALRLGFWKGAGKHFDFFFPFRSFFITFGVDSIARLPLSSPLHAITSGGVICTKGREGSERKKGGRREEEERKR